MCAGERMEISCFAASTRPAQRVGAVNLPYSILWLILFFVLVDNFPDAVIRIEQIADRNIMV